MEGLMVFLVIVAMLSLIAKWLFSVKFGTFLVIAIIIVVVLVIRAVITLSPDYTTSTTKKTLEEELEAQRLAAEQQKAKYEAEKTAKLEQAPYRYFKYGIKLVNYLGDQQRFYEVGAEDDKKKYLVSRSFADEVLHIKAMGYEKTNSKSVYSYGTLDIYLKNYPQDGEETLVFSMMNHAFELLGEPYAYRKGKWEQHFGDVLIPKVNQLESRLDVRIHNEEADRFSPIT